MANTLNGMVVDQLLTRGLSAFTQALTPLRVFSLDFSEGIASEGTTVKSRIIGTATAEDLSSDLSGDYEGGTYNTSTTEVSVTLNKHPISRFHFTDEEWQEIRASSGPSVQDRDARACRCRGYADDRFRRDHGQQLRRSRADDFCRCF